jgi:hypothetical protein
MLIVSLLRYVVLARTRGLGVDRSLRNRVPEVAFERLAAEGARMTAQHIRDLSDVRRQAVLAATAIRMEANLTDAALAIACFFRVLVLMS